MNQADRLLFCTRFRSPMAGEPICNFLYLSAFANLQTAPQLHHNGAMECRLEGVGAFCSRAVFRHARRAVSIGLLSILTSFKAHAAEDVSIELSGDIEARCRFTSFLSSAELGEVLQTGTQQIPFQIDCNTPFSFEVRSREGALKGQAAMTAPGFANIIPYTLELKIPTDEGLIASQCASSTLAASTPSCGRGTSGSAIAIEQTGSLTISWSIADVPVAGSYADIVTVTVGPRF